MEPNNPNRMYAALGIAGQAGCLTVTLAVAALLFGLWLDQLLGTRRIFALICVAGSVPIALFVTLRVTQRLIARMLPPDKPKKDNST
jgi:4-amino-4-deoxy-L-arabinose transferase-like glycosyltransferase